MIRKISVLFLALAFMSVAFAQYKQYPNLKISGDEVGTSTAISGLNMSGQQIHFPPVQNSLFTWTVNPITTLASGYDLQSNGSTQELWYDLTNGYLHAAYVTSQEANLVWSDRTITYFFSDDQGANWSEIGNVPPPAPTGARAGFPSIIGLSNGAAVITSHHNGGDGLTTSKIHIDSGPAEFNFTQYNPGNAPNNQGSPIWGKMTLNNDGNVVINSSISGGDSAYTNVLNTSGGTFSGWNIFNSDQAETYALATSPSGRVGNAYIGGTGNDGKAFYRYSDDGGLTWSTPVTIFSPAAGDTTMGTIRGVDITFAGESPCVVYEVVWQVISSQSYFAGLPSEIHFWNPNINGGNYIVVADSNNVPYYPYNGINDVQTPICRPVIGKAQGLDNVLFVAFDATTEFYDTTPDTTSFCAGYFMVSQNAGATWTVPEKFTPSGNPLLDFRFPSIAPVAPVTGNVATVHISMQGDPLAGSQVNSTNQTGVTAQFYHFTTEVPLQTTADIPVTFNVDMGVQAFEGNFPAGATVVVRGSFQADFGDPGGNWQGNLYQLSDADGDTIYTGTFNAPAALAGNNYAYKYVIVNPPAGDNWESTPDRPLTITAPATNLPTVWFNDDNVYTILTEVTNTINFTADITDLLNSGVGGAFDPAQDSLLVMGLDWDNLGKNVTGNRRMVNNDPFNTGIYTTTLTVTSGSATPNGVGDSTKWKYKAFPDARFVNGGWETGNDRWHIYVADGSTVTLPTIVPRISALQAPLTDATPVQFTVDMSNAVNRYNGLPIPLAELEFVGIRGGADFLGNWASGSWQVTDTTLGFMKVLHNVGGNLWRVTLTAPIGQNSGLYEYKYAAYYPGADTVNGGSSPLDNEAGFGENHIFNLQNQPSGITIDNEFGNMTDVKEITGDFLPTVYDLGQNYPNPFNPTTSIRFSIPEAGLVTLKVFNLLGQEVATLVNNEKTSGVYEATFDASSIASGIYFYTLEAKNFTSTKKMILLK